MGIVDTVKDVAKLVQRADNIELYGKILELQSQIMGLLEENRDLKEQLRELRDNSDFRTSLVFEGNCYVRDTEAGREHYCSKCLDAEGKAIRLQRLDRGLLYCPSCQRSAPGSGYDNEW